MAAEIRREYEGDGIVVVWEPRFCIHTARCIQALPAVFNPRDRPWVHVEQAGADAIADAVSRCPTGALHFRRTDGGPEEAVPEQPQITVRADGPLYVRGRIRLEGDDGALIREDSRVALCRCGASGNKPFCDNSHRAAGFRDRARATP